MVSVILLVSDTLLVGLVVSVMLPVELMVSVMLLVPDILVLYTSVDVERSNGDVF